MLHGYNLFMGPTFSSQLKLDFQLFSFFLILLSIYGYYI